MGKILAIDFGKVRLGLAYADTHLKVALPFKTILAGKSLAETVENVCKGVAELKDIEVIVIGLPLLMNGQEGDMAHLVRLFAKTLEEKTSFKVLLQDERLTSSQADVLLRDTTKSRKDRAKKSDPVAAMLLLQSYLQLH